MKLQFSMTKQKVQSLKTWFSLIILTISKGSRVYVLYQQGQQNQSYPYRKGLIRIILNDMDTPLSFALANEAFMDSIEYTGKKHQISFELLSPEAFFMYLLETAKELFTKLEFSLKRREEERYLEVRQEKLTSYVTNKFPIDGPSDLPKEVWNGDFQSRVAFKLNSRSYCGTVKTLIDLRADLELEVNIERIGDSTIVFSGRGQGSLSVRTTQKLHDFQMDGDIYQYQAIIPLRKQTILHEFLKKFPSVTVMINPEREIIIEPVTSQEVLIMRLLLRPQFSVKQEK